MGGEWMKEGVDSGQGGDGRWDDERMTKLLSYSVLRGLLSRYVKPHVSHTALMLSPFCR